MTRGGGNGRKCSVRLRLDLNEGDSSRDRIGSTTAFQGVGPQTCSEDVHSIALMVEANGRTCEPLPPYDRSLYCGPWKVDGFVTSGTAWEKSSIDAVTVNGLQQGSVAGMEKYLVYTLMNRLGAGVEEGTNPA